MRSIFLFQRHTHSIIKFTQYSKLFVSLKHYSERSTLFTLGEKLLKVGGAEVVGSPRQFVISHARTRAIFPLGVFPENRSALVHIESLCFIGVPRQHRRQLLQGSTKGVCEVRVACMLTAVQKYSLLSSGIKSRLSADFYYAFTAAQNNFQTALALQSSRVAVAVSIVVAL
jgi:hypothetical protein